MKQGKYRATPKAVKYIRPRVYAVPDDFDPEEAINEALQETENQTEAGR